MKKHVLIFVLFALLFVSCNGHKENQTEQAKQVKQENKPIEIVNEGDTLCYPSEYIPVDRNEVQVYVSEDERMRLYCWNTYQGGTFTMGATPEQGRDAYDDEVPTHRVTLSDYSIGETQVTQALWQAVMGSNPSLPLLKGDDLPVGRVSSDD